MEEDNEEPIELMSVCLFDVGMAIMVHPEVHEQENLKQSLISSLRLFCDELDSPKGTREAKMKTKDGQELGTVTLVDTKKFKN